MPRLSTARSFCEDELRRRLLLRLIDDLPGLLLRLLDDILPAFCLRLLDDILALRAALLPASAPAPLPGTAAGLRRCADHRVCALRL